MNDLRKTALPIGRSTTSADQEAAKARLTAELGGLYGRLNQSPDEPTEPPPSHATAIVPFIDDSGAITFGGARLTRRGIEFNGALDKAEWERLGKALIGLERSLQWIIGDWIAYGNNELKVSLETIAEMTDRKIKTLQNWAWVVRSIPFSRRKEDTLFFGHHALVAGIEDPAEQDSRLQQAIDNGWSVAQFHRVLQGLPPTPPPRESTIDVDDLAKNVRQEWGGADQNRKNEIVRTLSSLLKELRKDL